VETTVIPLIIQATVTISKSSREYLNNIPGKHNIKELQKITIPGTVRSKSSKPLSWEVTLCYVCHEL
jgi:hypothetical protein